MAVETHYWGNYVSAVVACGKSIGSLSTCREHLLLDGAVTKICGATGPRATLACVLLLVYEPAMEMSKSIKNNKVLTVATVCILLLVITF